MPFGASPPGEIMPKSGHIAPSSQVGQLERELDEARAQQAATSEILRVISSSPTDIQPVLDAVAENAARLCHAEDVVIRLVEGQTHRPVAHYGPIDEGPARTFSRKTLVGRAVLDRVPVHIPDV